MRRDADFGSADARPCSGRGGPRANRGLEFPSFASSTSSASNFYPPLRPSTRKRVTSRIRCNLLKTKDPGSSYPQMEPAPFGGVAAARWCRETASRTASQRSKIPLSNRTPAKEPSR